MRRPNPASSTRNGGSGPPIEAVLFDLGGVLIQIDFPRAFDAWATHAGVPAAQLAARFRFDADYARHETGALDAAGYFAALGRTLGIELPPAQWLAGWNALLAAEMPGMRALIGRLAATGMPLFLFSNSNEVHRQCWSARHAGLLQPFRAVFVSSDLGLRKPDSAAYAEVIRRMGVAPERVLFLDDLEANVAGARAAGLRAHRVDSSAEVARTLAAEVGLAPVAAEAGHGGHPS